jgi:hypothetical protein
MSTTRSPSLSSARVCTRYPMLKTMFDPAGTGTGGQMA